MDSVTNSNNIVPHKAKRKIEIGSYITVFLALVFVLLPFYILLITSVQTANEANYAEFHWWPKMGFSFDGYHDVLFKKMGGTSVVAGLWNTLWIYLPGILVGLFMSALSAYAFAKLDFRLKNFMFSVLMITMMVPNCMATIASFLLFDRIGWVNTPFPLMIPRMFGSIGTVFFLQQYFMGVPDDLIGAAKIDGLNNFEIFLYIMLPIAMPAIFSQYSR